MKVESVDFCCFEVLKQTQVTAEIKQIKQSIPELCELIMLTVRERLLLCELQKKSRVASENMWFCQSL